MYPDTLAGLLQSYVNGLPFLRFTLAGNLIFTLIAVGGIEVVNAVRHRYAAKEYLARFYKQIV